MIEMELCLVDTQPPVSVGLKTCLLCLVFGQHDISPYNFPFPIIHKETYPSFCSREIIPTSPFLPVGKCTSAVCEPDRKTLGRKKV